MSLSYIADISFVGCIILTGYCFEVTDSAPQKAALKSKPVDVRRNMYFFDKN